jgi:hypothetical protein
MVTAGMAQYLASGAATLRVDPLNILLGLASLAAIITCGYSVWRVVSRRSKSFDQFFRDWNGEGERPGVPHRPGVMERLTTLEVQGAKQGEQLTVIHNEVNYNHGGSLKDAVESIRSDVKSIHDRMDGQKS